MKLFLLTFTIFLSGTNAWAKDFLCQRSYINSIVLSSRAHTGNDKNMHCTASCRLTLRCHSSNVLAIGYAKEIQDLFTPGDAEWKDIVADVKGINLVLHKRAENDKECFEQCDLYYRR